jgi:tetratricopeptide (TPR) repeat protein/predicted Ser/Thr protein kinase
VGSDELEETSVAIGDGVASSEPTPGARIGRYVIREKLGAGGMGEVWAAHDPELDRVVAIKLVKPSTRADEPAHERMLREAQALARLSHPNVVAVYDAGTHGDRIFIAMEYVEGRTLSEWMHERRRDWTEVVPMLLGAGEGLMAAHRQGIVHRDFKPANVMVDAAGNVRVLDFGLARQFDDDLEPSPVRRSASPDASSDRLAISSRLTRTGMVMGTPAFMAPEQFAEEDIDARADQFSFCVVAYRALWDRKPFPGGTYGELRRAVQGGHAREPPREVAVPKRIRKAVMRGLSVWPRDRYPTMEALLVDLRLGRAAPRRVRTIAIGVVSASVLGLGGFLLLHEPAACRGADDRVTAVWGPSQRASLASAFQATALPYADDASARVQQATDAYAREWIASWEQVCAAEQSEQLLDRRMVCLDERLRSLGAWVDLLVAADAEVVRNAAQGAAELPAIRDCSDPADAMPAPPIAIAGEVEAIRGELANVRAMGLGGRFSSASTRAEALLVRARGLDYPPLLAEVALVGGYAADRSGEAALARADFEEALLAAELARHDRVRAEALIGLTNVLGYRLHDREASLQNALHAEAVLARLGDARELRGKLALYRGNTEFAAGNYEPAIASFEAAIDAVKDMPSAWQVQVGALSNLAASKATLGDLAQGVAALESARKLAIERIGALHPTVAVQDTNLAGMYSRLERHDDALAAVQRALASYRAEHGEVHPDIGRGLNVLGTVLSARGDDEGALAAYRESLAVKEKATGADPSLAMSLNNIGSVLVRLHRPQEATAEFRRAASIWTDTLGPEHVHVGLALSGLAEALLEAGDIAGAADAIERAETLVKTADVEGLLRARTRFVHARVVLARDRDRARALELANESLLLYRSTDAPASQEIASVETWLAKI